MVSILIGNPPNRRVYIFPSNPTANKGMFTPYRGGRATDFLEAVSVYPNLIQKVNWWLLKPLFFSFTTEFQPGYLIHMESIHTDTLCYLESCPQVSEKDLRHLKHVNISPKGQWFLTWGNLPNLGNLENRSRNFCNLKSIFCIFRG